MPPKPPSGGSFRALRRLSRGEGEQTQQSAMVQAEDDKFWRSTQETHIFAGPLGAKCGDIPEGFVAKETMRFTDPFDNMWISIAAADDSIVWLQRYVDEKDDQGNHTRRAVWEPVVEATSGVTQPAAKQEEELAPFDASKNDFNHPLQLLTPDLTHFDWYTHQRISVAAANNGASTLLDSADCDWNTMYQEAVEAILFNQRGGNAEELRQNLHSVVSRFADAVEEATVTIVREMFLPSNAKTIKRHPSAVDVYFHKGMMLNLCVDTAGGIFGGDIQAMKATNQTHRATIILADEAPKHFLHVPLTIVMTYRGYRVRGTSIPPVLISNLVFGAPTFDQPRVKSSELARGLVESCGKALNLRMHELPDGESTPFPVETQVVSGLDERFYLLNTSRLLPPVAPQNRSDTYNPVTSGLLRRHRPELISELDRPVSCDAFFPGCTTEEINEDNLVLTRWLRDSGIPTLGAILGLLQPFNALGSHHHPQTETKKSKQAPRPEEMLTFVVCRSHEECCRVSAEKYYELHVGFMKAESEEDYAAAAKELIACVRCDSGARNINGCIMKPSVTQLFHMNGVGLRYLPFVYYRIPQSARPCTAHYLEIEMMARAAKNILLRKMRVARDDDEINTLCANFYHGLLRPEGELAETFWSEEMGPEMMRTFNIFTPFDTANIDNELVYERVAELTGVELSDDSILSINSENPFIQLHLVHPIMKMIHLPELCQNVGGHEPQLKMNLERLLLFWMNEKDKSGPEWHSLAPVHLQSEAPFLKE